MCGIAGVIASRPLDTQSLQRMGDAIAHRGPDDHGIWIDDTLGVGLAHRRLSIVDLSPLGHQPMISNDGRYVVVYNGEIYNHAALRTELEQTGQYAWRGHSDTETLIECIAAWGLTAALEKCVGMFALALWDRKDRVLHLARDRFGEKPLYYGWTGGDFVFASELKAIRTHSRFDNEIDRNALRLFAARTYVPAPFSIYRGIFKLDPGCILSMPQGAAKTPLRDPPREGSVANGIKLSRYWSYREVVRQGLQDQITAEGEALERLEAALAEAIRGQSMADVPVGAFLSGGIDSSAIVALYQKYSSSSVRTFTIGFQEAGFNEAEHARNVARHLGTDHNERYVTVKEAQDVIPLLPSMYDEPFADSSQVPTHLVSKFAREQVTVALSGDGGDELFAGYNRHFQVPRLWSKLQKVPRPIRKTVGGALGGVSANVWNELATVLTRQRRHPVFGSKIRKGLRLAGSANSVEDIYRSFLDEWSGASPVLGTGAGTRDVPFDLLADFAAPEAVRMMYSDAVSYLPDDILCKVDRASMAVSLETRVPFLDHRVAEIAARIPLSMKIRGGEGKYILRQLLYREAPAALFERPKTGFSIPVGEWLRGPLRPWAEELLHPDALARDDLFDAGRVQRRWKQHLDRSVDATPALWAVLMFQSWRQETAPATTLPAPERLAS